MEEGGIIPARAAKGAWGGKACAPVQTAVVPASEVPVQRVRIGVGVDDAHVGVHQTSHISYLLVGLIVVSVVVEGLASQ